MFFLDYIACGKNYPEKIAAIVSGVAEGCVQSECALVGGETAEHPGLMPEDDYDLAGFDVVAVSDIKYSVQKDEDYRGYKVVAPTELLDLEFDLILITTQYPVMIRDYLLKDLYKNKKKPKHMCFLVGVI